jgi:glycosidase
LKSEIGWGEFYKRVLVPLDSGNRGYRSERKETLGQVSLRQFVEGYGERILLGEMSAVAFYGNGRDELHSVFDFRLVSRLEAPLLRQTLAERLPTLPEGGWEANTIGNHHRTRSYSFYSDGLHDELRARIALAMVMFLRGTPMQWIVDRANSSSVELSNTTNWGPSQQSFFAEQSIQLR